MSRKKVIVTGGAGYIGSHTVVELVNNDYCPVIIDDFSNSEPAMISRMEKITGSTLSTYKGRIQDPGLLESVFQKEGEIEGVIHFAAFKAVGESVEEPLKYYDNNINSTIALLRQLEKSPLTKLIFSSSCTVYGQPDILPVSEQTPRKPAESPYGNTKQICEDLIRDFVASTEKTQAVSLRYFNPIGAHPSGEIGEMPLGVPANLIPYITQTAAGIRNKVTVFGNDYSTPDGTCIRDYIHVMDLANAHVKALEYLDLHGEVHYEVFNAGMGKGVSVMEVIHQFQEVANLALNYEIGARREGDVEKIWADTSKINHEMNWYSKHNLKDALESAWLWQTKLSGKK